MSRARSRWISLSLASVLGWSACVRKTPPPSSPAPPPPPVIRVPAGCLDNLSGTYVHALNPSFGYVAVDDGGTLKLAVERSLPDAGVGRPEPNPISVSLSRTAVGFVGQARAMLAVTEGRICPVEFPTEIIACGGGGLLLKSASSSAVDESCRASQAGARTPMAEHRLIRTPRSAPPSPPDAGPDSPQ